jgi:hypothetical protein
MLVVGPDGQSVRAFRDRIPVVSGAPDFYRHAQFPERPRGRAWNRWRY